MWSDEYTGETAASPPSVWAVLSDLNDWASWDTSMEWVRLEGLFAVGSTVVMKPIGQEPIRSTIIEVIPDATYADETEFGGITLRFQHTLLPLPSGGTRVTHRLDITGPAADEVAPELSPAITVDFPETMAGLLARAER